MPGLTMNYDAPHGNAVTGAHVRILEFVGDTRAQRLRFKVGVWYNEAAFEASKPAYREWSYTIPFTDGMTIDQAYDWLLTRAEFTEAIKVP